MYPNKNQRELRLNIIRDMKLNINYEIIHSPNIDEERKQGLFKLLDNLSFEEKILVDLTKLANIWGEKDATHKQNAFKHN